MRAPAVKAYGTAQDLCPGYGHCRLGLAARCWKGPSPVRVPCLGAACDAALRAAVGFLRLAENERVESIADVMERAAGRGSDSAILRTASHIKLFTLLVSIARNVLRERGRKRQRSSRRRLPYPAPVALALQAAPRRFDPRATAEAREALRRVRAHLVVLPPPCREIVTRLSNGAPPREIRSFLKAWRPVGDAECKRLIRLARALLRALDHGRDARTLWPRGWEPEKNPWSTIPPPPEGH